MPVCKRLVHRLAGDDARRLHLEPADLCARDGALAVDRLTQGVDDAADQRVADGDREDAAGVLRGVTLFDLVGLAEHHGADGALVEVQREAERATLELEELVDRGVRQTRDACDAVTDLEDAPDLVLGQGRRERADVLAQRGCDLVGIDGQLSHVRCSRKLQ